jgi:hypothetical protein
MARLFDMYVDSPTVDISGQLRDSQRFEDERKRRNMSTSQGLLRNAASGAIRGRFDEGLAGAQSMGDADAVFRKQYEQMLRVNPQGAQELQARYDADRSGRIGADVAKAYQGAETDKLQAGAEALLPYDPKAAIGMLDRAQPKAGAVYTPEQKQLMDAREQNRLQMQKAQSSMNQALSGKNQEQYQYWKGQVDNLKLNDTRLNNQLASTGLQGYETIQDQTEPLEPVVTAPENNTQGNYEKAKGIVQGALNLDSKGMTTKDAKIKASNALKEFNASLGKFPLSSEELQALNATIESANVPLLRATNEQTIEKIKKAMSAEEFKGFQTVSNLYNAGLSNYDQGLFGTAIQNFIKAANPGEAVMADDVNMANKGQVSTGMLTFLKKIGYDATNDNVQDIAQKLGQTATQAIQSRLNALDTYGLTDEQKALFVKRYMSDVKPRTLTPKKAPLLREKGAKPSATSGKKNIGPFSW